MNKRLEISSLSCKCPGICIGVFSVRSLFNFSIVSYVIVINSGTMGVKPVVQDSVVIHILGFLLLYPWQPGNKGLFWRLFLSNRHASILEESWVTIRFLTGTVKSMKMKRTIIVRRDYLHYIKKYNRFEKRHKNMSVHLSPCFRDVELGDMVVVGQCRPLSKTVRFNVLKVQKQKGAKKVFKKF